MPDQVYSITELTQQIKSVVESNFPAISVRGEISNFKLPGSGHVYMTLKDEGAQIPAVIWKNVRMRLPIELKDGLEIIARGRLEVYPPSGRYQLICTSVALAGEGMLQQAFAALLKKLAEKGYFKEEHKQQLPEIPEKIGLITSPTGAVIEDMRNVLLRRFPAAELLLYPVQVQGEKAADNVISALSYFNSPPSESHRPDVIIVARGGGSLEDLQAFNEESVALALFDSKIPVISAIGHETDVTITDMVADVRAGTPSIAAEIAAPDTRELLMLTETLLGRQCSVLTAKVEGCEQQVSSLLGSYAFNRPLITLERMEERVDHCVRYFSQLARSTLKHTERHFAAAAQKLFLLNYTTTLERGFALVKKGETFVTSSKTLKKGEQASILFHDGETTVETIEKKTAP